MTSNSTTHTYYLDYEDKFTLTLSLFIIYATLYLPSTLLFFLRRNHHPIKLRSYELALFHTLIPLLDIIIRFFEDLNCIFKNIRVFLILPLWIYPYFFRALHLWYRYNYRSLMTHRTTTFLTHSSSSSSFLLPSSKPGFKERMLDFFRDHPFFLSLKFPALFLSCNFVLYLTSAFLMVYFVGVDPVICNAHYNLVFTGIQGLFIVPSVVLLFYVLWGVNDPYLVKHEMVILVSISLAIFPLWLVAFLLRWGVWDQLLFGLAEILFFITSVIFPLIGSFHFSKWMSLGTKGRDKSEKDLSSTAEKDFWAVLQHPALSVSFEQFSIECWSSENLLFHKMMEMFKEKPEMERIAMAKKICDNFIVPGSSCEINLESHVRRKILENFQAGNITIDMFDEAEQHCIGLLIYSTFPLWKESSKLKICLKELNMKSIQECIEVRETLEMGIIGSHQSSILSLSSL